MAQYTSLRALAVPIYHQNLGSSWTALDGSLEQMVLTSIKQSAAATGQLSAAAKGRLDKIN